MRENDLRGNAMRGNALRGNGFVLQHFIGGTAICQFFCFVHELEMAQESVCAGQLAVEAHFVMHEVEAGDGFTLFGPGHGGFAGVATVARSCFLLIAIERDSTNSNDGVICVDLVVIMRLRRKQDKPTRWEGYKVVLHLDIYWTDQYILV